MTATYEQALDALIASGFETKIGIVVCSNRCDIIETLFGVDGAKLQADLQARFASKPKDSA
jgi:hypothetical protein